MEFNTGLIPLETALEHMLTRIVPVTESQTLPLLQAAGRITAKPVVSPLMSRDLIIPRWMATQSACWISPRAARCR